MYTFSSRIFNIFIEILSQVRRDDSARNRSAWCTTTACHKPTQTAGIGFTDGDCQPVPGHPDGASLQLLELIHGTELLSTSSRLRVPTSKLILQCSPGSPSPSFFFVMTCAPTQSHPPLRRLPLAASATQSLPCGAASGSPSCKTLRPRVSAHALSRHDYVTYCGHNAPCIDG